MSVEVNGLTKIYGEQKAINSISFSVKSGEVLGFLGPNGAGKSTTMKILSCFIPSTSGTATVNGYDIQSNSLEVRKLIGYLPENNPLYLDMYVKEYLHFAGQAFGIKENLTKKIDHLIDILGISAEKNKIIGSLSKGYKQRIGLAQALINDPKILILDEPTSGLDPNQLVDIRQLIKELGKEKTIIFSTHIMQEVQAVCSRAIIINKGKIVADDSIDALIHKRDSLVEIEVQFLEPIEQLEIEKIESITKINKLQPNYYRVFGNDSLKIRAQLSALASENKNAIILMKENEKSLEDAFFNFTNKL
ncbi:MAG: ATP-binding cassette domain-containing protein [Bacteroidetes bacterium]|nr:ATP-binding cassette domain-containing protein [Bacteroidota bacterium]MBP7255603.1 ATP-binding cassette domain-containing protein [Chitinophagales bacterium]MBK7138169.1 ATP-binding cassette domain-containing protein [Bacteroidota bacterium]MBK7641120.1 ATP-binding cassette domain-containing protein [Bacteroidota bacterium]MBK8673753.1 ATP-binding cassette domain-containing protein [Bacteroidota bacterium]